MKLSLIGGLLLASIVLVGCNHKNAANNANGGAADGAYAELAQCLTDNGVKMYGTERCSHCKNQKSLFGADFANVTYIDCDAQKQVCMDNGIQGYPTWKDADGNFFPGVQSLEKLAEIGGCSMDGDSEVEEAVEEVAEDIEEAADDVAEEVEEVAEDVAEEAAE